MQPADRMLKYFRYAHLPAHLQEVSRPFGDLAEALCRQLSGSAERTVALRKLVEAKDCAVRAMLDDIDARATVPIEPPAELIKSMTVPVAATTVVTETTAAAPPSRKR